MQPLRSCAAPPAYNINAMPPTASGMLLGSFGELKFFSKFAPETAQNSPVHGASFMN
jgi:hypothetical protein